MQFAFYSGYCQTILFRGGTPLWLIRLGISLKVRHLAIVRHNMASPFSNVFLTAYLVVVVNSAVISLNASLPPADLDNTTD